MAGRDQTPTSFRLAADVREALAEIAEADQRSQAAEVTWLILRRRDELAATATRSAPPRRRVR